MFLKQKQRIVLDTNVCLDLFVFQDQRWNILLTALEEQKIEAVTRPDCRMEWLIVLNYIHLKLDNVSKTRIAAKFDSLIICIDEPPSTETSIALPVCSDPDDQKFLELAHAAKIDVLITKDKALLKLAKKTARFHFFKIMKPETWLASTIL
jgi:putative PIN family toxin of toxin-antitoxin system